MSFAREGLVFIAIAALIAAGTYAAALNRRSWPLWLLAFVLTILALWVAYFFRDPERTGPRGELIVIAPADGKVVLISEVDEPTFMGGRARRVSIFMNVFNVHVNRYPVSGTVRYVHYNPGKFLNAAVEKSSLENEQMSVGIETSSGRVLVRQIAGLIARRIVTYSKEGEQVEQGQRMGLIRFGSRVDVFMPLDVQLRVKVGDMTLAGSTAIAELGDTMNATRRQLRRPSMRRAVILFPSGLTLGNLFFGIFAIIAASRQDFVEAGVYVLLGGACDALDGQVARATNAGTQFGEELDSLVDAITFGLAPGLIMYFAVLNQASWDWLAVFLFSACAVMRLARFNIEQAGTAKTYFQGLPSPAAGITLASYYWFSQSWLYNYGAIANLKWHVLLRFLMAALAFLMISNIPYPVFPRTGFRSLRAIGATLLLLGSMMLLATRRLEFFFPAALCYVAWGPIRWVFSGLFQRRQPTIPYDLSEGEDDEDEEEDAFGPMDSQVHATRQSEREMRPATVERERTRRDRAERGERPAAPARVERSSRAESGPRPRAGDAERAVGADRAATTERAARGERSDADRAARREKREKREKRRERDGRAASTPAVEPPESGVGAITLGGTVTESAPAAPVLSVVRAEEEAVSPGEGVERPAGDVGPTRKRKRRRRRGQRDRNASDTNEPNDAGDGAESGESEEFEGPEPRDSSNGIDSEDRPAASRPDAEEERPTPSRAQITPPSPPAETDVRPAATPQASTPLTDNNE